MKHAYLDEYSGLPSPIHHLDPRIKVIAFFSFILFVIFTRPLALSAFLIYGLVILFLTMLSGIPPGFIFRRILAVVPFALMTAAFLPFFKKGDGAVLLWNCFIKAVLSVACMALLMATTRFSDLLKSLEMLKVPGIIVMILSFLYRYVFVIEDDLMRMARAKAARSVGGTRRFHARALANLAGALFVRSYERAERVYLAMASRGFSGEVKTLERPRLKKLDLIFLLALLALLTAIRVYAG